MTVSENNRGQAQPLLKRLKEEFRMSQRDIAVWCGVNQPVVTWWSTGKHRASDEHLDRLREALVLLSGRNIRYPKQALDILMGRE